MWPAVAETELDTGPAEILRGRELGRERGCYGGWNHMDGIYKPWPFVVARFIFFTLTSSPTAPIYIIWTSLSVFLSVAMPYRQLS